MLTYSYDNIKELHDKFNSMLEELIEVVNTLLATKVVAD